MAATSPSESKLSLASVDASSALGPQRATARRLLPLRAGDPLGLGLARPPPGPDPDAYDRVQEDAGYARSLLSEDEKRRLDRDIETRGFTPIEDVRRVVAENCVKGSVAAGGLDPEVLALLDTMINYKIFIADDTLYTREELHVHYPFHEFGVQPEDVFAQQELGVFELAAPARGATFEYVVRDAGDESIPFAPVADLLRARAREPDRVVKTKVYVGKERWQDFLLLQRVYRGAVRVAAAGSGPLPALRCGAAPWPALSAGGGRAALPAPGPALEPAPGSGLSPVGEPPTPGAARDAAGLLAALEREEALLDAVIRARRRLEEECARLEGLARGLRERLEAAQRVRISPPSISPL
jgi:hypothetical protein